MKQFLLLTGFLMAAAALQGQTLSDGFESYTVSGTGQMYASPTTFGSWNVTVGSVDILNSFPGISCRTGTKCVDMDGSSNAAGTITRTFTGAAGVPYTLTYYYSGNQRGGSDSMTVSMGTATVTHTAIPSTQGFTLGTLTYTPAVNGTVTITFAHAGGDNVGLILDDVAVSYPTGTPALSTWGLIGLSMLMALFGAYKVRANTAA